MQAYLATRISPHIARTPEGFIIATAPIARSGWQDYKRSEVDRSTNDSTIVRVFRPVSEVTSRRTIASGEGKPIVSPHPAKFVDPDSWSWTSKGHIQNVRVGKRDKDGNVTLVADLHIHDGSLIDKIGNGTRDLSCGYTYDLVTLPDGSLEMRNIAINHVAVVNEGRAKTTYITDSKGTRMTEEKLDRITSILEKLLTLVGAGETENPDELELRSGTSSARLVAADSRRDAGLDFFDAVRQFHRRDIKQGMKVEAPRRDHAALDAADDAPVDFFDAARSLHRQDLRACREMNPRGRRY